MELKQFTGSGLENFKRVYLDIRAALSNGEHKDLKISELLSDKFTRTIDNEISLPSGPFKNRYDFAEKIVDSKGSDIDIQKALFVIRASKAQLRIANRRTSKRTIT